MVAEHRVANSLAEGPPGRNGEKSCAPSIGLCYSINIIAHCSSELGEDTKNYIKLVSVKVPGSERCSRQIASRLVSPSDGEIIQQMLSRTARG